METLTQDITPGTMEVETANTAQENQAYASTLTQDITPGTMEVETANTAQENQADASNQVGVTMTPPLPWCLFQRNLKSHDLLTGAAMEATDVPDTSNLAAPFHENMASKSPSTVVNHQALKVEEVYNPEIPSGQNIDQAMEQLTKEIAEKTESWLLNLIDSNPSKRVLLSTIPGLFRDKFGADIDLGETFQLIGYTALRGFLESFPSMNVQALPTPIPGAPEIVYVCRASELPNDDAYEGETCPGIRHETSLDGSTLYSNEEHSKKRKAQISDSPVNFKRSKVASEAPTDNDAALACLQALQGYDGPWPATIEEMETFLFDTAPNNRLERQSKNSVLVAWAVFNLERSSPRKLIKRLQQKLMRQMKCLHVQGTSYTWNRARVMSILAQSLRGTMEVECSPTAASSNGISSNAHGEEDDQGLVSRVSSASESPGGFDFVMDRQGQPDAIVISQAKPSTGIDHSATAPTERMTSTNEAVGDNLQVAGDTNANNKSTGPTTGDNTIDLTRDSDTEQSGASPSSHPVAQSTSGMELWNNTARISKREQKAARREQKAARQEQKATNPSKIYAAAVACLRIMSGSRRRWPSSGTDWKIFLLGTKDFVIRSFQPPREIASEPALISWLQNQLKSKKPKKVRASLIKELTAMGCIASNKADETLWNLKSVQQVLALNGGVVNSGVATTQSDMDKSGSGQMMAQSTSEIVSKNANGSPLPFQNTRSRLKPRKVTDHDAAVACLRILSGLKRPWPSKGSEWKVFIIGSATSNDFRPSKEVRKEPDLVDWLCEKMKAKTEPGKRACTSLRLKLFEYGYISSMKGDKIIWQQAKVQRTFACSKPHEGPNCVVDTTQADQGLFGAETDARITKANEDLVAPTNNAMATQNSVATGTVDAGRICFDVANEFKLSSYELMQDQRPGDIMQSAQLEVSNDTDTLIKLLPEDLATALFERAQDISDIVLDIGRRPFAWVAGKRLILGDENRLIEANEINTIVKKLGGFGTDNRAGIERQLHRISAIRNRNSDIIGLTMRVGRHVSGNTSIISDLLFAYPTKSILFLGEPGSGKTTVVREVARLLSEESNVCIVDTSNEIAGDGDTPHPCVGFARRLMVPSLDKQSSVMTECVQNHTPEVMIIDEIGRITEVDAAQTCKNRGVRLVASAHGDLRKLLKNPKLRGLVGGVQTTMLGDAMAALQAKKSGGDFQKIKAERAGPPTFDMIVELSRGLHHEWKVVMNTAEAVDNILQGKQYAFQKRVRDAITGTIHMEIRKS